MLGSARTPIVLIAVLSPAANPLAGQVPIQSRATEITITGRVHTQFNTTSVDAEPGSEFLIRRARLTAVVKIDDFISGKIQPDYGEGKITLRDAYLRMSLSPSFRITVGQFKRPFDLFELTSSTRTLVIERTGRITGVDQCAGPGGICSLSRFTEELQYSDRDIGVLLNGRSHEGQVSYSVSVTNGTGANKADENGAKSFTGRLTYSPSDRLAISGNVAVHDYVDDLAADNDYATAFGGDLQIGDFAGGLHVRAGLVVGDNWRSLRAGDPTTFLTAQGVVAYKAPVRGSRRVSAVEPLFRVSWGDPDTDLADDDGWLLTPGFVAHFSGRNKIAANVDIWSPSTGGSEWSLKVQSYLHF